MRFREEAMGDLECDLGRVAVLTLEEDFERRDRRPGSRALQNSGVEKEEKGDPECTPADPGAAEGGSTEASASGLELGITVSIGRWEGESGEARGTGGEESICIWSVEREKSCRVPVGDAGRLDWPDG